MPWTPGPTSRDDGDVLSDQAPAGEDTVAVSRIEPRQWQRLRDVRLASLRESPEMFGSSHAREQQFDDNVWRRRASSATTFVASRHGRDVGLATLVTADGRADVTGVWVDPAHRGCGVIDELMDAVAQEAARGGYARLQLEVMASNERGIAAYRRGGFELDGRAEVLGDGRVDVGMTRDLGRLGTSGDSAATGRLPRAGR